MKNTKKIIEKILAGIIALVIIGFILFIANSLLGNPISVKNANKDIKEYVDKNYSDLNLEVEEAKYEYQEGSYVAMAKSKTSIDTKFQIYYKDGEVYRDDYERDVMELSNTQERLLGEYSNNVQKIVSEELGYVDNTSMVCLDKEGNSNVQNTLKLDMELDKTLSTNTEVVLRIELEDKSIENIAKVLTDAYKALMAKDCNFSKYSLEVDKQKIGDKNGAYVIVSNVSAEYIKSGNLVNLLRKGGEDKEGDGIFVMIND